MYQMTAAWLAIWMADEFHDWTDGDDPVSEYIKTPDNRIWVKFESGAQFEIQITEVYE